MIEVKVNGGNFEYDIHSLVKAFYPGEEVLVREKGEFTEDAPLQMDVSVGDKEILSGAFRIYRENPSLGDPDRHPAC